MLETAAANVEKLQQDAERNAREQLPAFISTRRVCEIAGFSARTISRKVRAGEFPGPVMLSPCRYDLGEILEWRREQFAKRAEREKTNV